ncbi:hypothetical protein CHCC14600_0956 [Bacillus licheniformis]|uniref:YwqI/YxiC family protein n=1 Tax=Bacillus licheniformis TaxID=1402 RepID=UPI0013237F35|nr:hypothetical protein CHCC14600_0956 [Bacillus licheniformis]
MTTIKLKHETVIKKLEAVRAAIDALDLPNPPKAAGKNKLTYTTKCHEREQNIHQMVADYKKAVHKNIKGYEGKCRFAERAGQSNRQKIA